MFSLNAWKIGKPFLYKYNTLTVVYLGLKQKTFFRLEEWNRFFSTLHLGVDEAGRGAVLGPLVISSVLLSSNEELILHNMGVRDSKVLSPKRRSYLYYFIQEKAIRSSSIHISAESIDRQRHFGSSLNRIEEDHIFSLLKTYSQESIDLIIVDAFISKNNRLKNELVKFFPSASVRCEFHADTSYPCVAAASVVAKVSSYCFVKLGGA